MSPDIAAATAAELAQAIRDRQLSSRELLGALLARAERVNPALNAIVAWDVERAMVRAKAADDAIAHGEHAGPLHGLPMTVKDTWETAGLVTTSGAAEFAGNVPAADALGVSRLRQAGAIIFGKTNTPAYAGDWQTYNDLYGRTSNPWDLSRTAGVSSGGAAAAVAAGMTPLEFGSDIGGKQCAGQGGAGVALVRIWLRLRSLCTPSPSVVRRSRRGSAGPRGWAPGGRDTGAKADSVNHRGRAR